jgi:hypothetical protein
MADDIQELWDLCYTIRKARRKKDRFLGLLSTMLRAYELERVMVFFGLGHEGVRDAGRRWGRGIYDPSLSRLVPDDVRYAVHKLHQRHWWFSIQSFFAEGKVPRV